jgi:hypothetical protein
MVMDAVVVALLIRHSFSMFASVAGTWLPLALISGATFLVEELIARPANLRHSQQ